MLLIIKFFILQVFLIHVHYSSAICPYANNFFNVLSRPENNPNIYDNYMSTQSYITYDTDCYRFVPQPPPIPDDVTNHALTTSTDRTIRYISLDNQATSNGHPPTFLRSMDRSSYYFESVTKYIQETTCTSKNTTSIYLPTFPLEQFGINRRTEHFTEICNTGHIKHPKCPRESYRKIDGTCNNLKRRLDGHVGDCFQRLLPPDYKDGISQLRTSIDGSPLPNPRVVSMKLLGQDDKRPFSTQFTEFHAFFGELVIGDIGMTLMHDVGMRSTLQCCDHEDLSRIDHPQCAAFPVQPDDVLRQLYPNQKCMHFTRSIACSGCKLGPRMISNTVTAALDLSMVYGVSISMSNSRRTMTDGLLKSEFINGHELFAVERINATGRYRCFKGECELSPLDIRNLFAPTGLAFVLLFHRNHNRHARRMADTKPNWSDEKIFQEARKWNIAEYQHCLYNEYLGSLIGGKLSKYFRIFPNPMGQFSNYEPNVRLKTILEFQSTAGRHGHAALSEEIISKMDSKNGKEFKIHFRQSELFESLFYDGLVDGMLLAQMSQPAFETTASVPFKTFLFDSPGRTFGLDLGALDIQRQRDHGIPGYIYYLEYCHDVRVHSWKDLKQFIDSKNIEKLKQYYKYVEDVELYVGGHYERKINEAIVGPTFACIIGIQFRNIKYGDRFFYEHRNQVGSFTVKQLNEIKRKVSLASLLCKNTHLKHVLSDPLRLNSHNNQFVSCSVFKDIDYKL